MAAAAAAAEAAAAAAAALLFDLSCSSSVKSMTLGIAMAGSVTLLTVVTVELAEETTVNPLEELLLLL